MEIDTTYMCLLFASYCSVDVLATTEVVPVWLCFVSDHGACIHLYSMLSSCGNCSVIKVCL